MAHQKLTTLQKALIDPKYLARWGAARLKRVGQPAAPARKTRDDK